MSTDNLDPSYLSALAEFFNHEKIIVLAISVGILFLLVRLLKSFSNQLCHKLPSKRILISQFTTALTFLLHLLGGFYIFYGILKPPQELMIAILGSATFAVGFALKDLVSSLISGITIILDPPFQVGDRVKFQDLYGEVKHVGLRAVRIQTQDQRQVTIPNALFINEAVVCANQGRLNLNVTTIFNVPLSTDIKKVKDVLYEVVVTSKYVYLQEPVVINITRSWNADLLTLEVVVNAHTIDARYENAFQTDIYSRGISALHEHGVEFPRQKPTAVELTPSNSIIETAKLLSKKDFKASA